MIGMEIKSLLYPLNDKAATINDGFKSSFVALMGSHQFAPGLENIVLGPGLTRGI